MCVVLSHYCGVFWLAPSAVNHFTNIPCPAVDHSLPAACRWATAVPYLNWGPFGVAVFFLISGFVIPYSLARQSVRQFCLNRVLRIWPTYLVGFGTTCLAILGGCHFFGVPVPYSAYEAAVHSVPGIRDLIQSRDIDGVIWTLEIEMKFYVFCAASWALIRRKSLWTFGVPVGLAVLALGLCAAIPTLSSSHPKLASFAIVWLNLTQFIVFMYIGVVFHYVRTSAMRADQAIVLISGLFMLTCLIWASGPYRASLPVAWNYGFAVWLFAVAMAWPQLFKSNRLLNFLADISYPLYVIHGIAGYVLMRTLQEFGVPPHGIIAITTAAAFFTAWVIHRYIERPSQKWGKQLSGYLEPVSKDATVQKPDVRSVEPSKNAA